MSKPKYVSVWETSVLANFPCEESGCRMMAVAGKFKNEGWDTASHWCEYHKLVNLFQGLYEVGRKEAAKLVDDYLRAKK